MRDITLVAADISCEHCQKTIESGLAEKPGISGVVVDVATKAIHIHYEEGLTNEDTLKTELDELGYPVDVTS